MLKIVATSLRLAPVAVVFLLPALPATASPEVVASIRPLHSVVAAVMDGVGQPRLVVEGAASPHSFDLRPSQARALQEADLIVLTGAGLEPFEGQFEGPADRRLIRMSDLPGMRLLPLGTPGPSHTHEETAEHDAEAAGSIDPHLWLDPTNVSRLAASAADAMAELDPDNAARYRANAKRFRSELDALDGWIGQQLEPHRDRPFVVGHDAYRYFTSRYGLRQVGVVALAPERGPGARTLRALRAQVEALAPLCVFQEPGMAPGLLRTLAEGVAVEHGELDPLGTALPSGQDHYPAMLRALTRSFVDCLSRLPAGG